MHFKEELRKEFFRRDQEKSEAFYQIVEQAFKTNEPIGINGYKPIEEQLLVTAMAICLNPNLLELSHCAHRAVVASLGLYFENFPDNLLTPAISDHPGELFMRRLKGTSNSRVFLSYGYNNWWPDNLPKQDYLNCKVMPGNPTEVPQESLIHLEPDQQIITLEEADKACPKRTKGLPCKIEHAERDVIEQTLKTFRDLGIPPADKTILVSTWVPCPDCFSLINTNKQVYGENIDVISLYGALGDEEDENMAKKIRETLQNENLGRLSGPFVKIPKTPGYGWYPARSEFLQSLERNLLTNGYKAIPQTEVKLLARALKLTQNNI